MNRDDGLRPRRHDPFQRLRLHIVVCADVDQYRPRSAMNNGRYRRHEGMRHGDDVISRSDSGSEQRKMQRMIAAVHADGVLDADERRQMRLKVVQVAAAHEIALRKTVGNGGINLRLELGVMGARIDEGNCVGHKIFCEG